MKAGIDRKMCSLLRTKPAEFGKSKTDGTPARESVRRGGGDAFCSAAIFLLVLSLCVAVFYVGGRLLFAPSADCEKAAVEAVAKFSDADEALVGRLRKNLELRQSVAYLDFLMLRRAADARDFASAARFADSIKGSFYEPMGRAYVYASKLLRSGKFSMDFDSGDASEDFFKNLYLYTALKKKSSPRADAFGAKLFKSARALPQARLKAYAEMVCAEFLAAELPAECVGFFEKALPNAYDISAMDTEYIVANRAAMPEYPRSLVAKNNVWRKYRLFVDAARSTNPSENLEKAKRKGERLFRKTMVQILEKACRLYLERGDSDGAARLVREVLRDSSLDDLELKTTFGYNSMHAQGAAVLVLCRRPDAAKRIVFLPKNPPARYACAAAITRALGEAGNPAAALDYFELSKTPAFRLKLNFDIFRCCKF